MMAPNVTEDKKKELGQMLGAVADARFTVGRVFEVIRGETNPWIIVPAKVTQADFQQTLATLAKEAGFSKILDKSLKLDSKECQREIKDIENLVKKHYKR